MASTLPSWASSVVFPDDGEKITKMLIVLQRKLKDVAHLWWQLGLQLKEHPAPLDGFKAENRKTVPEKFDKMLQHWICEGKDEYRTWGALAQAAVDSGNRSVANNIRELKHYREDSRAEVELLELKGLLKQLAPQWKTLSLYLGIDPWITDGMDETLSSVDCFGKVLRKWITCPNEDEEPTFEVLYKALESESVANRALAMKILKDMEVLKLLTVSKKEKDKEIIENQLKEYIEKLKGEEQKSDEEQQEGPSKEAHDHEKEQRYQDGRQKAWENKQRELDEKNAERLAKKENSKVPSPLETVAASTSSASSTKK